jgi:hypothetical protein
MNKIFTAALLCINSLIFCQPGMQWQKCLGGEGYDEGYSIQQTNSGGYILCGWTESNNGDVSGNLGPFTPSGGDVWVALLYPNGSIDWQKCLGGSGAEATKSVVRQTPDDGFIVAFSTISNDGDVIGNHGGFDISLIKLSSNGFIQWQRCYGGTNYEEVASLETTTDGGYIFTGSTSSTNADVSGNHGNDDVWLVKVNESGDIEWQRCYGGTSDEGANCVVQTFDGGFAVTGYTISNNEDVQGNHGGWDTWVFKVNSLGDLEWQKCLGGSNYENGFGITQSIDAGLVVAGVTKSNDGDVVGFHAGGNSNTSDAWVVKLTSTGAIEWQKCLGSSLFESASCIDLVADGGFIIGGSTNSGLFSATGNDYDYDYWIIRLDENGVMQWEQGLGGTMPDYLEAIQATSDGGYVMIGSTQSDDVNVDGNHSMFVYDMWVVKLQTDPATTAELPSSTFQIFPNPAGDILRITSDYSINEECYSIFNQHGQRVLFGCLGLTSTTIDIAPLSSGIYILLINGKGKNSMQFIKR